MIGDFDMDSQATSIGSDGQKKLSTSSSNAEENNVPEAVKVANGN